jgi:hypothetical protein
MISRFGFVVYMWLLMATITLSCDLYLPTLCFSHVSFVSAVLQNVASLEIIPLSSWLQGATVGYTCDPYMHQVLSSSSSFFDVRTRRKWN